MKGCQLGFGGEDMNFHHHAANRALKASSTRNHKPQD